MADIDTEFSESAPGDIVVGCPKSGVAGKAPAGCEYLEKPALGADPKVKDQWTKAIAADENPPSTDAECSAGEDFSESLVMYSFSKGTKCEAPAKARYPQRYKTLDAMFK